MMCCCWQQEAGTWVERTACQVDPSSNRRGNQSLHDDGGGGETGQCSAME